MKNVAILTSGGDAPGMNAAIRSLARTFIHNEWTPFVVYEGYTGLIAGNIHPITWEQVTFILAEGGTILKSARCKEFLEKNCRKQAVYNLASKGIYNLVVIGGDGSLMGAEQLRSEWEEHVEALRNEGELPHDEKEGCFSIMGLVGSIDNDMWGTEMTIGSNTSLHRIIEALDNITSTALSHNRAFVVEVMGRNCGWLALSASLAIGADYVFIPERPPSADWPQEMCQSIKHNKTMGRKVTFVIVAEGAVDSNLKPVTSEGVKEAIIKTLNLDARVTTLGHVQRGGSPSAFDRYLATIQGMTAAFALIENGNRQSISQMIAINENQITAKSISTCVENTRKLNQDLKMARFDRVFFGRDDEFKYLHALNSLLSVSADCSSDGKSVPRRLALVNVGAPCGGMNSANATIVKYCLIRGHSVVGVRDGLKGLLSQECDWVLSYADVGMITERGGSILGVNRWLPSTAQEAHNILMEFATRHSIQALLVVGGFEGFAFLKFLHDAAKPCIPVVLLPATVSNNVPGTEYTIGSDTACNCIINACDIVRQSASSSGNRLFVVEVQGGNCGYLATMSGLAAGASCCYIPEKPITLASIVEEARHLKYRFKSHSKIGRIVVRNEKASSVYTTEILSRIFEQESEGKFDSRWLVLGHLQQGGNPTPLDRLRGVRLGAIAVDHLGKILDQNDCSHALTVVGFQGPRIVFSSIVDLLEEADFERRVVKHPWWLKLYPLVENLSRMPGEK